MRNKRPKQLSEIDQARLIETARVFCRSLNELSSRVAPTAADYWTVHELNLSVLATVEKVTGQSAPWILPTFGASYPDEKGGV